MPLAMAYLQQLEEYVESVRANLWRLTRDEKLDDESRDRACVALAKLEKTAHGLFCLLQWGDE